MKAICSNCKTELPQTAASGPCPTCGSRLKEFVVILTETIELLSSNVVKKRGPAKKRPLLEIMSGEVIGGDGRPVHKVRVIDRERDHYCEDVVELKTGKRLRHKDEPLSQHRPSKSP